uniref:Uncharacterized protein n=2 Tax=unclassified Caudoviricetes TaxID=2788787 RepID=A0A8S5VC64_9CAUD|nr:MAG TPA: hypothetical protein [Siphoviridae sp. ctHDv29]DAG04278.1 MAG TPA: hypothetical protein [Siphoviridae sp. ctKsH2]
MLKMVLSQPEIKMKIAPAKVVYQGGEAYEGDYEITPSEELQTLPTANRMLARNIVVAPIPKNYGRITYSGGGIIIT